MWLLDIIPPLGQKFCRVFCDIHIPSLYPWNLPALSKLSSLGHLIICDQTRRITAKTDIQKLNRFAVVEFVIIKELFDVSYLQRIFSIFIYYTAYCREWFAIRSKQIILLPIDSCYRRTRWPFFQSFAKGFEVCGVTLLLVNRNLPNMWGITRQWVFTTPSPSPRRAKFQHQYFSGQLLTPGNQAFGKHARELFIPKGKEIAIRSVFIHPLAIRADVLQRYSSRHYANIDYGLVPNVVFDEKKVFLTGIQSDCYINNFCENERRFETEPTQFNANIFARAHEFTYRVQRKLFKYEQTLPCASPYETIPGVEEVLIDLCEQFDRAPKKTSVKTIWL